MENRKVYTLNVVIYEQDKKAKMITRTRVMPIERFRKFTVYEVGNENPFYFVVHLFHGVWCAIELTTGTRLFTSKENKITESELIEVLTKYGIEAIREAVAKTANLIPVMPVNNVEAFLADNPPQQLKL